SSQPKSPAPRAIRPVSPAHVRSRLRSVWTRTSVSSDCSFIPTDPASGKAPGLGTDTADLGSTTESTPPETTPPDNAGGGTLATVLPGNESSGSPNVPPWMATNLDTDLPVAAGLRLWSTIAKEMACTPRA